MECLLCGDAQDHERSLCKECLSLNVSERKKRLQKRKDECVPLRDLIKAHIDSTRQVSTQNWEYDLRAARIGRIKERIAQARQRTEEVKSETEQQRSLLKAKREDLQQARALLATHTQAPIPKQIEDLVVTSKQRALQLASQRRTLIAEILSFFPVNPYSESETESRIIELILPNNGIYSGYPAELLSAALGYIAHVVHLVTSYLGVVLPYTIEFAGSRSVMRSSGDPSRKYPLYGTRGADMEVGVRLLNCDIIYLCYTQGLSIPHSMSNQTLPNLMLLLRCPTLGWPGPRDAWASPRPQRQLPPLRVQAHQSIKRAEEDADTNSSGSNSMVFNQDDDDGDRDEEEEGFIVLDNTVVPTPSQSDDLAQFERAMFIDTS